MHVHMWNTVADPGFLEGGYSAVLRAKRARNFKNHAHFGAKPCAFQSFLRQTTSPTSPIDLFSNEFSSKAF